MQNDVIFQAILNFLMNFRPGNFQHIRSILGSSESPELLLCRYIGANTGDHYIFSYVSLITGDSPNFMKNHEFGTPGGRKIFSHINVFCSIFIKEQY